MTINRSCSWLPGIFVRFTQHSEAPVPYS